MIELYQLEQLITIAQSGTISKAAEKLLISQPGLTRSIQRLEEDLDLKLFDRTKNKITLNENGQLAVEYAKNILKSTHQMVEELQKFDRSHSTISIGSCTPAPLWGLKYTLSHLYPESKITEQLESQDKLLKGLKENNYSLIVLTHPIEDKDYICIDMFEEHLYISVPPAHPLALFNEISFRDLDGQSILLLSHIGFWSEICQKMLPKSHLLFQEDTSILNELTKVSALPNFRSNITIQKPEKNRVFIPITDPEAKVHYYGIYHKDKKKLFTSLKKDIKDLDWNQIL